MPTVVCQWTVGEYFCCVHWSTNFLQGAFLGNMYKDGFSPNLLELKLIRSNIFETVSFWSRMGEHPPISRLWGLKYNDRNGDVFFQWIPSYMEFMLKVER